MPYGLRYPRFITFSVLAGISTLAGSQCVHNIYKPLEDLDDLIEEEYKRRVAKMEHK